MPDLSLSVSLFLFSLIARCCPFSTRSTYSRFVRRVFVRSFFSSVSRRRCACARPRKNEETTPRAGRERERVLCMIDAVLSSSRARISPPRETDSACNSRVFTRIPESRRVLCPLFFFLFSRARGNERRSCKYAFPADFRALTFPKKRINMSFFGRFLVIRYSNLQAV